jgi:hypothetical protein
MSERRDEGLLATIVTTEHFTLQTARAAAINQANGRTAAYLGTVSSSLIALAFVGQITGVDSFFRVFGLVLLLPLALVGVATFERTLQLAIEDVGYAMRINRLRRFYFQPGVDLGDYLMAPPEGDDVEAVMRQALVHSHSRWQPFLTNAWVAAVVNSFLTGVLVGVVTSVLGGELWLSVAVAACGFVLAGAIHYRHGLRAWSHLESSVTARAGTVR